MRTSLAVAAGCLMVIVGAASLTGQSGPTFYKDVLPILQKNCQSCHRPGEVAPMSLLTYRRRAAVGQGDQGRGGDEEDAAMVCRSERRPLHERSHAERRGNRDADRVGR